MKEEKDRSEEKLSDAEQTGTYFLVFLTVGIDVGHSLFILSVVVQSSANFPSMQRGVS